MGLRTRRRSRRRGRADLAGDAGGGAALHLGDAGAQVCVSEVAGEQGAGEVAQARLADLVAQLAVLVGEGEDDVEAESGLVVRAPLVEQRLHGLLAALALGLHGIVVAVDEHGDEGLHRVLEGLLDVHMVRAPIVVRRAPCAGP
mgnify:CR=1 FL=1